MEMIAIDQYLKIFISDCFKNNISTIDVWIVEVG